MQLDGKKLYVEIARRQMTIGEFAKAAGVPTSTIYRVIGGGRPNTRTWGKIAAALKISSRELLPTTAQMKGLI